MTSNDRLATFLLIVLLAIAATIIIFAVNDPSAYKIAEPHTQYETMQVGGTAGDRDEQYWWIGWLVGSLMLTFIGGTLFFGIKRNGENNAGLRFLCSMVVVLLLVVFSVGCFAYRDFGRTGQPLVNSIAPTATKLLLFGVSLVPLLFTVVYVAGFHRWFLTDSAYTDREQQN